MLPLPTILREYDKVARQCAVEQVDYQHYLLRITELELLDSQRRATERRIRQAKFPVVKTMDSFDFLAIPSLNFGRGSGRYGYATLGWFDTAFVKLHLWSRRLAYWLVFGMLQKRQHWRSAIAVEERCQSIPASGWSVCLGILVFSVTL